MSTALYKKVDYSLSRLIHDIDNGEIGLPDIQRPFVWPAKKVRDLFDSMYKGFPVGFFLFWSNEHMTKTRQIGVDRKQHSIPRLLIVDGQQRLTSLYAVLKGKPILTKDYRSQHIKIAFRPGDESFEVADAAIKRDPEYIADISEIWSIGKNFYEVITDFLNKLKEARAKENRDVTPEEQKKISEAIANLYSLQDFSFTALEISSTVDEEQVSEIFVRINSRGKQLNQADFILTLLSVFWDDGRKELENFCRAARQPSADGSPSPFNHFIYPEPDQLLRASIGLGFKRARLKNVYSILRGKDLQTGNFSEQRREEQFEILKEAQGHVLNLQNWHEFFKCLVLAGYRSSAMISSQTGLIYSYVMFLIGKINCCVDLNRLRKLIAKWYFMVSMTSRYTSSSETMMEEDLVRLRGVTDADTFVNVLEKIIADVLTNDFWNITLVNDLETSSSQSPALRAYFAALNLLDAEVLFSDMKISELLDPALRSNRSPIEKHHLFPKNFLKSIGITSRREINQVANYASVEWADNAKISDLSPVEYFPKFSQKYNQDELKQIMYWHALPEGWEGMNYFTFLEERRKLMARVIRDGFKCLDEC